MYLTTPKQRFLRAASLPILAVLCGVTATSAVAQEVAAPERRVLEEIVVTAQKRAENARPTTGAVSKSVLAMRSPWLS